MRTLHDFDEDIDLQKQAHPYIRRIMRELFYTVEDVVLVKTLEEDKRGVDFYVKHMKEFNLPDWRLEAKIRREDWGDISLEPWMYEAGGREGWASDYTKITELIMWFWLDTLRFEIFNFKMLREVFRANYERWKKEYKYKSTKSVRHGRVWNSGGFIPVPSEEIYRAQAEYFSGMSKLVGKEKELKIIRDE